jgi:hypothetical protein
MTAATATAAETTGTQTSRRTARVLPLMQAQQPQLQYWPNARLDTAGSVQAELPLQAAQATANNGNHPDRCGFDIGWDHAHHGLVPPAELLLPGTPVQQGWAAAKALFGSRTLATTRSTRQWLTLRLQAWREGRVFDTLQVTPNYLAQVHNNRCPVTRVALHGVGQQADTSQLQRINPQAGYAAGNLVTVSLLASKAWAGADVAQAVRHARLLEQQPGHAPKHAPSETPPGLTAAAWWRLATLRAFATPLPFAEAACLPLAVLPPNRVRVLNAAQGLQVMVTMNFTTPGWAARCRALAQSLPAHSLRHDFNLFVGAMAPRVLEVGVQVAPQALRHALEDAWLQERVQRRWQHFVLSLGEAGVEALLQRASAADWAADWAGKRTLNHAWDQATDGWALADQGRDRAGPANRAALAELA